MHSPLALHEIETATAISCSSFISMVKIFVLALFFQAGLVQVCFSQATFVRGADISFLDQIETDSGVFKENGVETDCLKILADHGFNYIRLRLWNNPSGGFDNLSRVPRHGEKGIGSGFQAFA